MATSTSKDAKPPAKGKSDPKAKHESEEHAEGEASAPKKKGSLLKKLLLILLPLLLIGGGAGWYFLRNQEPQDEKPQAGKAAPAKAAKAGPTKPPTFVPLEPFTVNLQLEDVAQYLQVGISLRITDPAYTDAIKLNMPEIRNRILLLLSSKKPSQISTLEGKQALSAEIMQETTQALGSSVPASGVSSVLFTSFIIQ
ncbi:MAG: flagellar basal body-associated protein FliL [Proteobacteria bacterium]|nr:flagellar basal body-associated protein FliL [Pseudomonadota bacterium]